MNNVCQTRSLRHLPFVQQYIPLLIIHFLFDLTAAMWNCGAKILIIYNITKYLAEILSDILSVSIKNFFKTMNLSADHSYEALSWHHHLQLSVFHREQLSLRVLVRICDINLRLSNAWREAWDTSHARRFTLFISVTYKVLSAQQALPGATSVQSPCGCCGTNSSTCWP